jgi:hypothetical protein
MNKYLFGSLWSNVFAAFLLLLISFAPMYANADPTFVNGHAYTIPGSICQNSNGVDLTQYFHLSDPDAALLLTVTVYSIPDRCGAVNITDGTATSGSTDITPSGAIVYIPSIGFTGTEHFTLVVTDGTLSDTLNVTVNVAAVTASVTDQTNVNCNGGNNGSATVAVSGPVGMLTYDWAPGTPTGDGTTTITGLTAGVYTLTASDGTGCEVTQEVTITEPAVLNATASVQTAVSCNGGTNGVAGVSVTGGTIPYTYSWSVPTTATTTLGGLSAGTYSVMIADANGCADTDVVVFTDPALLTATVSGHTDVLCNGGATGTATVDAAGGTGALVYSWSPAGGTLATATGLSAGDYTVTVTDNNSCTQTAVATINEPTALTANITGTTDASCNGGSNGTATVTANGGTAPYTYAWNDAGAQTTSAATGLAAGSYTVTVTDANSCTQTAVATINEPTALTANITGTTDASCNGGSNGTATVTANGGTAPYTYAWNDAGAQTTSAATGLAAGSYTVTVTDANSCTQTAVATITEPTALTANITATTDISCNGGSNGTATVTATGGTAPYTYAWNDAGSQTTSAATGLATGSYTVTVTDNNSCTQTAVATINEPTALTANITATTDVSCNGGTNGTATVTAAGGTAPYTYAWNDAGAQTTSAATGLATGSYTVTVTDANSCTQTAVATINEPTALTANITATTDVSCNGGSNGTATVTATGGTAPYTYAWNDAGAQTTSLATGLATGSYTVTVTDNNSCTQTAVAAINEPTALTANITSSTDVSCNGGSNGTATVTATGGTTPYTYAWNDAGTQTTSAATGLATGSYTVTVTDNNSCTQTAVATINEPTALAANITATTDVSCNGGSNGTATVTATGGTAPYTYAWNDAGGQTTSAATGLAAGNYTVTVTDNNSCTQTAVANITEPTALTATIVSQTDISCFSLNDGSAVVGASGGSAPYIYSWSPASSTSATINNLSAGTYTATVTDNNGCQQSAIASISEPAVLSSSVSTQTNVSCNGGNNGALALSTTGGTAPYSYSWSPSVGTTGTVSGLVAGDYTVTVTDAHNCFDIDVITITQPALIATSVTAQSDVACRGNATGSATIDATGGAGSFTYSWSPSGGNLATASGLVAGDYTVTVTDANNCTATQPVTITEPATGIFASVSSQTNVTCNGLSNGSAIIDATSTAMPLTYSWSPAGGISATGTGLAAGTYSVTIADASSCTYVQTVTITEPPVLTANITATTDISCNGGSNGTATVTAAGGTAPYTYAWNDAGAQTTSAATGLAAGSYTVTITDNNSCTQTAVATINEPALLTASITATTNVSCNGGSNGSATVTAGGGTTPYTYAWSNGAVLSSVSSLIAASYTVTVTDNNGCTQTAVADITEPTAITANITATTDVSCNGGTNGSATVTAAGGTAPYTYAWSDAGAQTTSAATGLAAGSYTVTITDANSCTQTAVATITEPTAITANITATTDVSCNGGTNGNATVTAAGGTAPYTYAWSDAGAQTTSAATGLAAGSYTVTITDNNSCTQTAVTTIIEPTLLTASITATTNVSCNGGSNGSATVTAGGGTTPYTYAWSNGAVSSSVSGLIAASYTVTVTDNNGCTQTAVADITEPTALTANITATTDVSCNGGTNGNATVTATDGTAPYTYAWSDAGAQTTSAATGLAAGSYTVTITDANSCTQTAVATITEPTAITANITATTDVSCNGGTNGTATVTAAGGTAPYTYAWSDAGAQTTSAATGLAAGSYTVTVTDANSCTQTAVATINEPALLTASITATTNVSCNGGSNGSATVTAGGGTTPYTYAWSNGAISLSVSSLIAASYTVTVTDNNGCTQTAVADITEPTTLTANITATTDVSCNGGTNGSATVTAAGGTAPYTYAWSDAGVQTTSAATGLAAGSYTVTITDANSCTQTAVATITEPTAITANITATTDVSCNGGTNGTATVTATGGTAPYTYEWNDAGAQTTSAATGLAAGSYTVTVTDANSCTQTAVATIIEPTTYPSIVAIGSNGPVCSGATLSLSSLAGGGIAPYTFSWVGPDGFTSTEANPSISSAPVTAGGVYSLTVTDAHACITATDTMTVVVNDLPVIVSAGSNSPVCAGATLSLNVTATAAGSIDYSWTGSDGFSSTEQNPGINTTTMNGIYTYTVIATGNGGCNTQAVFTATVNPLPHATAPADFAICNGASTTLISFGSDVPGTTFDWTNDNTSIGLVASGSGDIAAFTAVNTGTSPVTATIIVTPSANGCTGITDTMIVTVNPTPQLTSTLTPAAICDSTTFSYTPASLTAGTSYVWSRDVVAGISNPANADNTDPAEVLDNTTADPVAVTYVYTLSANGCTNTQSVVVTVNPTPVLTSTLSPAPICNNTLFSYTPTSATAGTTFTWSRDTMANILNPSASGSDDPTETLVNVAPYPVNVTYTYTLSANGCAHTQSVTATVNPSALLSSTLAPASICDSAVFNYLPTSLTSGTAYSWSRATVTGISNAAGSGTGNPMEVLYNTTADSIAVNYIYTLTAYGCTNTQTVQVYVKPTPKLTSTLTPAAICNNTVFNYTPASATGGTAFTWTRATASGISTPANSGAGNPMEVLHNMTASPVTTRYVFTLSAAGCTHSQVVTAKVNPTPALSGTTVGAICSGSTFVYGPGSATAGTGFTWTRATVPGITNAAGSGADTIEEVLTNATNIARTVVYRYTLTANGCSNIQNVIISVEPAPVAPSIAIHPDAALCSHTMYQNFGAATPAPDTVTYTWAAVNAEVYAQGAGHTNALVSFPYSGQASVVLMSSINGYTCYAYDTFNVTVGTSEAPNADVFYVHDHFYYTDNTVSSYQWGYDDAVSLDSVILAGQIDQNYFESAPDLTNRKYWVMTTKDGCMSKSYYNAPVGVVNVNSTVAVNLAVAPNPASNMVVVAAEGLTGGNDKVELTDMTGKLITTVATNNNKALLDVTNLASGVYVVSYYHNGVKVGSTKLVKE